MEWNKSYILNWHSEDWYVTKKFNTVIKLNWKFKSWSNTLMDITINWWIDLTINAHIKYRNVPWSYGWTGSCNTWNTRKLNIKKGYNSLDSNIS